MRPRVFVVNWSGHDFSKAEKYGEIIKLTEGLVNIFNPERLLHFYLTKLKEKKFNFRIDYILISGSPVVNLLLGIALENYESVNLLIYDAKKANYVERNLNLKIKEQLA